MKILENGALRDATPEEIAQRDIDAQRRKAATANDVREERNLRLSQTDWTQMLDVAQAVRDKYAAYRQALRDVPQQAGFPDNIQWPAQPE